MSTQKDPDCIFCKIVDGEIPSFKVYEDERTFAFADINPLADGHTLVISKSHAGNLWEIDPEDLAAVHKSAQKVAQAMKESLGCGGIAVLQLNGRDANQIVMHYHVHLIPRSGKTDGLSILEWESEPGDMELIGRAAEKIKAAM